MAEQTGRGIIDSNNRILEEVLDKPAFKEGLRLVLMNIDPQNSPRLVRTILGTDVEVPLAIVGALPALANAVILALDELIIQVREKFPPVLLADIVESLLNEIDPESLARVMAGAKDLSELLSPVFRAAWTAAQQQQQHKEEK